MPAIINWLVELAIMHKFNDSHIQRKAKEQHVCAVRSGVHMPFLKEGQC